ncbi:Uncharacterised protein [Chryseobacterium gleum]|uniref:Uncharacterized protein n=2 Tax=Chryseobacterium gleum TaxID=250 RepID=A0A448B849_CHRGE|nr:hypothetical protein [Chryseobacterium gleum]EFK36783.1 hypothetical protein HMPREF0204_11340 [Chryseobacterium gleum ATCC 35910]QQY32039.1 hypothetical protein I6I60_24955 [Chryseobacterium gleum]VEE10740.1 Uncharacterised protein [Chryseobacterium gleum]
MPKNVQGQVVCINEGKTINGTQNHPILKVEGNTVMPRGYVDQNGMIAVNHDQVQAFEVYICDNCKYTELYKLPQN